MELRIGLTIFCCSVGMVLGFLCGQHVALTEHKIVYDTTYINVPRETQTNKNYYGQSYQTGMFLRCQDSIAYQVAAEFAHNNGYSDMYWNNQADRSHWDMWDGAKYRHIFLDDILK